MTPSPAVDEEEVRSSASAAEDAVAPPSPAAHDAAVETVQTVTIVYEAEDAISSAAIAAEPTAATAEGAETAEAADMSSELADLSAEAAEAHDDAVLDLIAHEMAALDPADADDPSDGESYETEAAELASAAPVIAAETEPQIAAPEIQPSPQPADEPAIEPSLGSSLIANGIVPRPRPPRPDPLAPIRRMSQTEKIALFS